MNDQQMLQAELKAKSRPVNPLDNYIQTRRIKERLVESTSLVQVQLILEESLL